MTKEKTWSEITMKVKLVLKKLWRYILCYFFPESNIRVCCP